MLITTIKSKPQYWLFLAAISLLCAFSAFIILFFLSNYASLFFAYDFDIPAFFDEKGINFYNQNPLSWSRDAYITILLSIPISGLIIGFISLILLMVNIKKPVSIIILLLWSIIFSLTFSLGILINDAIWKTGTYQVVRLMNMDNIIFLLFAVIYVYILIKVGIMIGKIILLSFENLNFKLLRTRLFFFFIVLLFPWIATSCIFCIIANRSLSLSFILVNIPVLLILIPIIISKTPKSKFNMFKPATSIISLDVILTISAFMLSIIFIMLMQNGITIVG